MTTKHTTTISTQATESDKSGTVRTTEDTTTHTDSKTDTSKKVENLSMTTDPTTGIISIVNAVNLDNAKSKGQLEYLIIFLGFNFLNQTTVKIKCKYHSTISELHVYCTYKFDNEN
jgi:hypothetical protein